jgi:hypothetical protein
VVIRRPSRLHRSSSAVTAVIRRLSRPHRSSIPDNSGVPTLSVDTSTRPRPHIHPICSQSIVTTMVVTTRHSQSIVTTKVVTTCPRSRRSIVTTKVVTTCHHSRSIVTTKVVTTCPRIRPPRSRSIVTTKVVTTRPRSRPPCSRLPVRPDCRAIHHLVVITMVGYSATQLLVQPTQVQGPQSFGPSHHGGGYLQQHGSLNRSPHPPPADCRSA